MDLSEDLKGLEGIRKDANRFETIQKGRREARPGSRGWSPAHRRIARYGSSSQGFLLDGAGIK
jgi:hypothetical protein